MKTDRELLEAAQDAIEAYKSFDDWKYADREADWKWMFEAGQKAESEACAKLCDEQAESESIEPFQYGAEACAKAIRERGEQK